VARPNTDGGLFSFRVKIERPHRTFLFGGDGFRPPQGNALAKYAVIFRVDEAGDRITIGQATLGGEGSQYTPLGTLNAGETAILNLDQLIGVYAECPGGHSFVDCTIVQSF